MKFRIACLAKEISCDDGKQVLIVWNGQGRFQQPLVFWFNDVACSSAIFSTVDNSAYVGRYTSIAIGSDDLPVISYIDVTNIDLKVAKCSNTACSNATLSTLDTKGAINSTSIAIGSDGLPVISYSEYTNHDLKVAKCGNLACDWSVTIDLDGYHEI